MNLGHFLAISKMRWQTTRNRFRKAGRANWIIAVVLFVLALLGSLGSFLFTIGWGKMLLARMEPFDLIYAWDAIVCAFLFFWATGLMVELQRSELLSLKNLMHLPVSLSGAFFLNYASSFASLTVLLFLPTMFGVCVASVLHFGMKSLVTFALLASFMFMVTTVTYQLRGWLARLMENKRTRGTMIAVTTIVFVMVFQIPNLVNMSTMKSRTAAEDAVRVKYAEKLGTGELSPEEYESSRKAIEEEMEEVRLAAREARVASTKRTMTMVNAALPIGWLPYGASAAAQGSVVWPWLCVFGMSTIGLTSLRLAYRSTVRAYTGEHNKDYRVVARQKSKTRASNSILEKDIPFLTGTQSVVATSTFRSMLRAPEAKMALLTPLIFACVFGSMFVTGQMSQMPDFVRAWYGVGVLMCVVGMSQMMFNMFGLDRQGFRAYVLMPAERRDILLGKNIGILPFAAVLTVVLVVFVGIVTRMHLTHIVATMLQVVVAFMLYFPISNYTSIYAPIGLATGTMKPVSLKFSVVVVQFFAFLLSPLVVFPAIVALGAEMGIGFFYRIQSVPIYLLLTLVQLPVALWFYRWAVTQQGRNLQQEEQKILDVISKVAD